MTDMICLSKHLKGPCQQANSFDSELGSSNSTQSPHLNSHDRAAWLEEAWARALMVTLLFFGALVQEELVQVCLLGRLIPSRSVDAP